MLYAYKYCGRIFLRPHSKRKIIAHILWIQWAGMCCIQLFRLLFFDVVEYLSNVLVRYHRNPAQDYSVAWILCGHTRRPRDIHFSSNSFDLFLPWDFHISSFFIFLNHRGVDDVIKSSKFLHTKRVFAITYLSDSNLWRPEKNKYRKFYSS